MNFTAQDVEQMINVQHDFYYKGMTKSVEFRKAQLVKLKQAVQHHEAEIDQEARRIEPSVKASTLFEECHFIMQNKEAYLVTFEEGLIVQKWIEQLLG